MTAVPLCLLNNLTYIGFNDHGGVEIVGWDFKSTAKPLTMAEMMRSIADYITKASFEPQYS